MTDLWVARDADDGVFVYPEKPVWQRSGHFQSVKGWIIGLSPQYYPDLKTGECRRLVMEKETSE